jgi:C4-dicarboxylate transporter
MFTHESRGLGIFIATGLFAYSQVNFIGFIEALIRPANKAKRQKIVIDFFMGVIIAI